MSKFRRASPIALTCLSVAGMIGTAITAVRATPKALELIREKANETGTDDLSPVELVQTTWRCYIPSILLGTGTLICIVGIGVLDKCNQASLVSAYSVLQESYKQYRQAAKEVYGENADSKIHAEIAKDAMVRVNFSGLKTYSMDMDPESERVLCCDLISGRYFNTTMAAIINAQYHINRNFQLRGYCSVNEYYDFLGLEHVEHGDEKGWDWDNLADYCESSWIEFNNQLVTFDDGLECIAISSTDPSDFPEELIYEIRQENR